VKPDVQPNKIVVLSGSGISAESGLPTFRDSNGLWRNYRWQEVASPETANRAGLLQRTTAESCGLSLFVI
jgi:NAD-dependent SIR2 family protein deacetylase